ncbi:MAG: LysR family transcriptional regulator [bacterium]|nr:LysR family transcriptional regulator [bacterium]
MDLDLLKTFLEVSRTGHFGQAAANLHLTQSAVSARIRLLEDELGQKLFVRGSSGVRLSEPGQSFSKQAVRMLALWEESKELVNQGAEGQVRLSVALAPAALELYAALWIDQIDRDQPKWALRLSSQAHTPNLLGGEWDLYLGFEAPKGAGLEVLQLGELPLVLVSSTPEDWTGSMIEIDWGANLRSLHARRHPEARLARFGLDSPHAVLGLLNQRGGAAYLPQAWAGQLDKNLVVVSGDRPLRVPLMGSYRKRGEQAEAARSALLLLQVALNGDCGGSTHLS